MRLCEREHETAEHAAIVRKIVAAHDAKRTSFATAARGQRRDEKAHHAHRFTRMRKIVRNVRMLEIEPARRWIVAIALFRDGKRYDARCRIGQARVDVCAVLAEKQNFA